MQIFAKITVLKQFQTPALPSTSKHPDPNVGVTEISSPRLRRRYLEIVANSPRKSCWQQTSSRSSPQTIQDTKIHQDKPSGEDKGPILVLDKTSGFTFIIDTEASRSVILARNRNRLNRKLDTVPLIGPDGWNINTFGNLSLNMNLGTTRKYKQEFMIANVKFPILRAEFLSKFDLRIDLKKRVLISKNKAETSTSLRRRNATTITIITSDEEEPQPKHPVWKISSPRRTSTPWRNQGVNQTHGGIG